MPATTSARHSVPTTGQARGRGDAEGRLPDSAPGHGGSGEPPPEAGCGSGEPHPALLCVPAQPRPFALRNSPATASGSFLSVTTCASRSVSVGVSSLADTALRAPSIVGLTLALVARGTTFWAANRL